MRPDTKETPSPVHVLKLTHKGHLIAGTQSGETIVWSISSKKQLVSFTRKDLQAVDEEEQIGVSAIAFSNALNYLAVGFMDGTLVCWDLTTRKEVWFLQTMKALDMGSSSSESESDASEKEEQEEKLERPFTKGAHSGQILALAYIDSSELLVSSSVDTLAKVWEMKDGTELAGYQFIVPCFCYDKTIDFLFSGGMDGKCSMLKIAREGQKDVARVVKRFDASPRISFTTFTIFYHEELDMLVTGCSGNLVKVWKDVRQSEVISPNIGAVIAELNRKSPQIPIVEDLPDVKDEKKLLELSRHLYKTEDEQEILEDIAEDIEQLQHNFQAKVTEEYTKFVEEKENLRERSVSGSSDAAKKALEKDIARKIQALKAKQEEEMNALLASTQAERDGFEKRLQETRQQLALEFSRARDTFLQQIRESNSATCFQMRQLVCDLFLTVKQRYQVGCELNEHSTSVFKCVDLIAKELVAIKAFPMGLAITTSLSHPAIVRIRTAFVDVQNKATFVVMDLMKETLRQFIDRQPKQTIELPRVGQIMYRLLHGISYLHTEGMVHRDLRPDNILMNNSGEAMLTHFGIMSTLSGNEPLEEGMSFAAPEVLCSMVKTHSDVWSFACVFVYLLQTPEERQHPLFTGATSLEILKSMIEVVGLPSEDTFDIMSKDVGPASMPEEGKALLKRVCSIPADQITRRSLTDMISRATDAELSLLNKMLVFQPQERIEVAELLKHEYFAKFTGPDSNNHAASTS